MEPVAATVTTPAQLAGWAFAASTLELPAATTTVAPTAVMSLMACCCVVLHAPLPPRLRLRTAAGLGLEGTPATARPADQRIPSTMSEV